MVTDKDSAGVEGLPDGVCREAWEVSSDGVIYFDTNGHVRAFDRKFTDIAGTPVTDSAIEAMLPVGCRPPELLDAAKPAIIRSCELSMKDSRRLPVRLKCTRVRDGMLMAICIDPVRTAPEPRTEWFDALLNVTDAVIVVLDRHGQFVRFNRAAEELTGYSAEEALGQDALNLVIFEEEAKALRSTLDQFLERPEGVLRWENRWRMRDGSARLLSWCTTVTRDQAGNLEYVIGTAMDVTAVRKTERALASLSAEFLETQAAGRHDICSYLHDTISQNLLVLALLLGDLNLQPDPDTAANIEQAFCLLNRCCQDLVKAETNEGTEPSPKQKLKFLKDEERDKHRAKQSDDCAANCAVGDNGADDRGEHRNHHLHNHVYQCEVRIHHGLRNPRPTR